MPEKRNCTKLYLRCRQNPTLSVWYCDQLYGVNKIKTTVRDVCQSAGLIGKFSNHSLHATCASHMYEQQIPEQIIKEVTGHKSDCVSVYKRTSDHLREEASKTVSGENCPKKAKTEVEETEESETICEFDCDANALTLAKMIENVNKTKEEIKKKLVPRYRVKALIRSFNSNFVVIQSKSKVEIKLFILTLSTPST